MELESNKQKISYIIGQQIGQGFLTQGLDLDPAIVGESIAKAFAGEEPLMDVDAMNGMMESFQAELQAKANAAKAGEGDLNKEEGEAFLRENATKANVLTTESGLQYEVLTEGNGPKPTADQTVETHYEGKLLNGEIFDSSYRRGESISFPVGGVIQGWQEALQLMPQGSKWRLFVPSDLAYGEAGAGGDIGPHATLVFEVELLDIK